MFSLPCRGFDSAAGVAPEVPHPAALFACTRSAAHWPACCTSLLPPPVWLLLTSWPRPLPLPAWLQEGETIRQTAERVLAAAVNVEEVRPCASPPALATSHTLHPPCCMARRPQGQPCFVGNM